MLCHNVYANEKPAIAIYDGVTLSNLNYYASEIAMHENFLILKLEMAIPGGRLRVYRLFKTNSVNKI